jgi:hypothetical protein
LTEQAILSKGLSIEIGWVVWFAPQPTFSYFFTASSTKHLSLLRCPRQSAYPISTAGPFYWGYLIDGHPVPFQFGSLRTFPWVNNDFFVEQLFPTEDALSIQPLAEFLTVQHNLYKIRHFVIIY